MVFCVPYLTKLLDSRHVQLGIYTAFHVESESEDQIDQCFDPEEKIKENRIYEQL